MTQYVSCWAALRRMLLPAPTGRVAGIDVGLDADDDWGSRNRRREVWKAGLKARHVLAQPGETSPTTPKTADGLHHLDEGRGAVRLTLGQQSAANVHSPPPGGLPQVHEPAPFTMDGAEDPRVPVRASLQPRRDPDPVQRRPVGDGDRGR